MNTAYIRVSSTNLDLLTEYEARAVHQAYKKLFDQADYPLKIHSLQTDLELEPYADYLKERYSHHRGLWEDYLQYCADLDKQQSVNTQHLITTHVDPGDKTLYESLTENNSEKEVENEVERRKRQILSTLNTGELSAQELTKQEIKELQDQFPEPDETGLHHVKTGDEYRRFLYLTEYPSSLELGWPLDLLRLTGKIDITQVIQPRDPVQTVTKLNRLKEKASAELDSRLHSGFLGTNKLQSQLESAEWMLDSLADREQQPFNYGVYISSHASTEDQVEELFDQVLSQLKMMGVGFEEPVYRVWDAYRTVSPLHGKTLEDGRLVLSDSVGAGFPFATRTIDQGSGVIYGEDLSDNTPIILDRFQLRAPHLTRFGATGSGKTYHTKLELIRGLLAYPQLQIITIDPKQEYHGITQAFNGTTYTVQDRPKNLEQVTNFTVTERGRTQYIDDIIDLIEHLYTLTSQNQDPTLVVADEAHNVSGVGRGRKILTRWVREARDTSTAITLVSQSATDFTQYPEGRTLLDQVPVKIFFKHDRVSDSMTDYFHLSDQETVNLHDLDTGTDSPYSHALMKVSSRLDAEIRVKTTETEHRLIEQ